MRRRDFITLLSSAATAWPFGVWAQQPAMPVIGFLNPASPNANTNRLRAFRQGLMDTGYVEGENLAIELRWADGQVDRLPALAAELIRRPVALIVAFAGASSAAKAATTVIPIVFAVGGDPVAQGLVASLARPGGNLTGINFFNQELVAKRLELLRELVPGSARVAVLVNPTDPGSTETTVREVGAAARNLGLEVRVLSASTSREIDMAFATFAQERPDILFIGGDTLFNSRRVQLAVVAARYAVPAMYAQREYVEAGGLISYGTNLADTFRQVGVYAGRILKGVKPADLPVVQSSKFELIINVQTARRLGLTVPPSLLARADEVIE
jgi:putative tryptophan/tyrosine transport system substrate-binding protein